MTVVTPETIRASCRHYNGYKPCGYREDCTACPDFAPVGERILIVKLGALGDVLRTTPLLRGLKDQSPDREIVWLTSQGASGLLKNNPLIDQLWIAGATALARLQVEKFHRVICLDKDPEAAACATLARADRYYGFGMNEFGRTIPLNPASRYSVRLGLSDELKFRQNEKVYQALCFESAELPWTGQDYIFNVPDEDQAAVDEFLAPHLAGADKVIGFNLGGGDVFANKRWKLSHYLALRGLIQDRWGDKAAVLVMGGPPDGDRMASFLQDCSAPAVDTGHTNSFQRFGALLKRCDAVITGDSLGMHIALAVGTPCLVLVGSTTHRELELYGRGEMLVSDLPCAPCYGRTCDKDPDCMSSFTPELVLERLTALIG